MESMLSSESTAFMIASPPANTGTRSGFSPASSTLSMSPALMRCERSRSMPAGVMLPSSKPFCCMTSAIERTVPDEPTACCQLPREKLATMRLQLVARGELGLLHGALAHLAVRKEAQAVGDAAHEQAFELQRLVARADDELGRAAADVDDQPLFLRGGKLVGDAEIDEARLLASRHDLDREAERRLRLLEERRGVLRHAQRVGADRAHRARGRSRADARRSASGTRARAPAWPRRAACPWSSPAPSRTGSRRESRG